MNPKRILVNPKTGHRLTTSLTEEQALVTLKNCNGNFAKSLCDTYESKGSLSPLQYYWFFKLAEESKTVPFIQLRSNLQEFCSKVPTMQFQLEGIGKVVLRTTEDSITVWSGLYRNVGKIVNEQFIPTQKCPLPLKQQILLFSVDPMQWMQNYGRATGRCCVCGLELTNEESVAYGIGPICRGKF